MSPTLESGLSEHSINKVGESDTVPAAGLKMLAASTFHISVVLFRSSVPH